MKFCDGISYVGIFECTEGLSRIEFQEIIVQNSIYSREEESDNAFFSENLVLTFELMMQDTVVYTYTKVFRK